MQAAGLCRPAVRALDAAHDRYTLGAQRQWRDRRAIAAAEHVVGLRAASWLDG